MLWMARPRELVNVKCCGACQSIDAALSTFTLVTGVLVPFEGSMLTTSAGFTELSHVPTSRVTAAFTGIDNEP